MTIICMVAADFVNRDGEVFSVTGKELGVIKDAPDWIKDTLIFKMLVKDGSLKFVTKENRIEAENDPLAGINAEGKAVKEEKPVEETVAEEPVEVKVTEKKRTTRKKKDDAE